SLHDRASAAHWTENLAAEPVGAGSLRRGAGTAVETLPGYGDGAWWVQDAAAAIPARILLDFAHPDDVAIDLCAAPGGKTLQLAADGRRVVCWQSMVEKAPDHS